MVGQPHPPSKVISRREHSNRGHKLTREPTGQAKFKCNGCLEEITGCDRDTCKPCDFDLHQACNYKEGTTLEHQLLPKSKFVLRLEAPPSKQRCSACGTRTQGTHYHCARTGHYLHPCCAMLPMEIKLSDELSFELREKGSRRCAKGTGHPCCAMLPMEIKLSDELSFELREKGSRRCAKCREGGGVRDYWFYCSNSNSKKVHLHVACAREDFLLPSSSSTESHSDVGGNGRASKETALRKYGSGKSGMNLGTIGDIVKALAGIILAVLTGNPLPLISAGVDLLSSVAKLKK
ncbi:hypothetical protein TRIUR3_26878 [Triticum urartu]|uniref:DC1 domain-containing protein n=1 Tax=Triticum urartu TaxID=4572 RepID=M8A3Z1_TRIUA|nr:hypothetical protein TRIUR3_26878 [Triticum urartu]